MSDLTGQFREGDELSVIAGPYDVQAGGLYKRVGKDNVTRITVGKECGPMGFYAVALVFEGENEDLKSVHPLHMLESICLS